MSNYDCILAALLLTSPPDPDAARRLAPLAEAVRPALIQAALVAEILDPREKDRIGGEGDTPHGELFELQTRYQELRQAPQLADCQLFPPRRMIEACLASNRDYKRELEARLALDLVHAAELRAAIAQTEQLYHVWSLLRDAQYECFYVTVRRRALLQLRDAIGIDAYCGAKLPPHLPVWHLPVWR